MPEFVIHIGPHKTGSTYLQSGFAARTAALREHGVLMPTDQGEPGHVLLARKLADPSQHAELAAEIDAYAASDCRTVLLTAEGLSPLPRDRIALLRDMIGAHPVRVVFYCRGWADICASHWGETIKHGSDRGLDDAIGRILAAPHAARPVNYGLVLDAWAAVFGVAVLRLVSLQSLSDSRLDLADHFAASFLGLERMPPAPAAAIRRNRSLGPIDTEIIRQLNRLQLERGGQRDGTMRRRYLQRRKSLDTTVIAAAMQQAVQTIAFDERHPAMEALHQTLFATYGACLVAPHADNFFTPRRRDLAFIGSGYLDDASSRAWLDALHGSLR